MILKWVESMNFGKSMRWGSYNFEFIRPIRWLQVRLGSEVIEAELFGVKSSNRTYVHRMVTFDSVEVEDIKEFEDILSNGKVTLSQAKRRTQIVLDDLEKIEDENGVEIERDKTL